MIRSAIAPMQSCLGQAADIHVKIQPYSVGQIKRHVMFFHIAQASHSHELSRLQSLLQIQSRAAALMLVKEDPGILELSPSFIMQRLVDLKVPTHSAVLLVTRHRGYIDGQMQPKPSYHDLHISACISRAALGTLNVQSVNRSAVRALHRIASKGPVGKSRLEGHACGYCRHA